MTIQRIGFGADLTLVRYPQQRCYYRKVSILNVDLSNIGMLKAEKCEWCGFCFDGCDKVVKVSKWYSHRKPMDYENVPSLFRVDHYFHVGCFNDSRGVKRLA